MALDHLQRPQSLFALQKALLEDLPLEDEKIPKPGYVGQFKRNLKMKYQELIRQYSNPPDFLVINPLPQTKQAGNRR